MVKHRQDDGEIGVGLGGDPIVGLLAGGSFSGIDDDELGAGPGAAAQQVGEGDGVRFGLVGAKEEEVFA